MAGDSEEFLTDSMDLEHELFRPSVDSFYMNNIAPTLHLNRAEIQQLRDATGGQHECELWHLERHKRLTASQFHLVMAFNQRHDPYPVRALREMFHVGSSGAGIPAACQYGLDNETPAMKLYLDLMRAEGTPCTAAKAGMYVMESNPFLSATPDFIITSATDLAPTKWLLEVKCYTPKENMPTHKELALKYKHCVLISDVGGDLHVRKDHKFYYQIQGQLAISAFGKCDLAVFYNGSVEKFTIEFDSAFFYGKMLPKLKWFYEKYFIPELVTKRIQRGLDP